MATIPPPYDPLQPPPGYWYQRYWRYTNRPRAGCGCLYLVLIFFVAWWFLSLLYPPFGWRYWYGPAPVGTSMHRPDTIEIVIQSRLDEPLKPHAKPGSGLLARHGLEEQPT